MYSRWMQISKRCLWRTPHLCKDWTKHIDINRAYYKIVTDLVVKLTNFCKNHNSREQDFRTLTKRIGN